MRKFIFSFALGALCTILIFYIIGAIRVSNKSEITNYTHRDFVSTIDTETCCLCKESPQAIGHFYRGLENVGILNLNTLDLLYIEINRYDDEKQPITTHAGYVQHGGIGDGESFANAMISPDDGYAKVTITGLEYAINRKHLQKNFCQDCLDEINEIRLTETAPAEYAILDFSENTIYPLSASYPWFSVRNYGINCEFNEDGGITLLVHLLRTGI